MKQQIGRCILLVFGLAIGAPAGAQTMFPYPGYYSPLPPQEVMALVRSTGLQPLGRPERQGPVNGVQGPIYGVKALNRAGQEVRVIVDARMGRILKIVPIPQDAAAAPYDRPPGIVPDGSGPNRLGAVPPAPYGPAVNGRGIEADAPPSASGALRSPQVGPAPAPRPKPKSEQAKSEQPKPDQPKPEQSKPEQSKSAQPKSEQSKREPSPALASGDDKMRLGEPPLTPPVEAAAAPPAFDE